MHLQCRHLEAQCQDWGARHLARGPAEGPSGTRGHQENIAGPKNCSLLHSFMLSHHKAVLNPGCYRAWGFRKAKWTRCPGYPEVHVSHPSIRSLTPQDPGLCATGHGRVLEPEDSSSSKNHGGQRHDLLSREETSHRRSNLQPGFWSWVLKRSEPIFRYSHEVFLCITVESLTLRDFKLDMTWHFW